MPVSALLKKRKFPLANLGVGIAITASFFLLDMFAINAAVALAAADGDNEVAEAIQSESMGKYQDAEKKYREAIEKFTDTKRDFPRSFALGSLGHLYVKQNQLEKAVDAYKNALNIRKAVLARDTDDGGAPLAASVRKDVQKDQGLTMVALGSVYTRQRAYEQAEDILTDALLTIKTSWGPEHDCVGTALAAIGDLKFAEGNYSEAEKYYRQALTIRRKYHSLSDPALGTLLRNNAVVLSTLRKTGRLKAKGH